MGTPDIQFASGILTNIRMKCKNMQKHGKILYLKKKRVLENGMLTFFRLFFPEQLVHPVFKKIKIEHYFIFNVTWS
jgi:hypothetical protein